MRTRTQADALASMQLACVARDAEVRLAFTGEPEERATAWVYFYTSEEYLKTGDVSDALAGNGPIVVPKAAMPVWIAWTGRRIEDQVEKGLRRRGSRGIEVSERRRRGRSNLSSWTSPRW